MSGEQFSLCWDNFFSNMSSGLNSLLRTEDLVDVTLAAEGRQLKAHKMVLSVCSPYFRELFQSNPCQHPIVFLKDVSFNALSSLLEFMYKGEVKVSQDDLATFIKTAEALQIKGLTGDGASQNDAEAAPQTNVSSTEETTITRKSARDKEKSPPPRKKPMGPASKRLKRDTESPPVMAAIPLPQAQPSQSQPQAQQQQQPQTSQAPPQPVTEMNMKQAPAEQQFMHFKLEPEETAVSLTNEEDVSYDENAMDDMGIDNSSDYLIDPTTEMEGKAGTSTAAMDNADGTGDNQELIQFVQGRKGNTYLVVRGHPYVMKRQLGEFKKYWKCIYYDSGGCKCLCITSNDGQIFSKSFNHTHPPNRAKIAHNPIIFQGRYIRIDTGFK